ncbi:MAG: hypothetical protein ACRDFQ_08780, partial [Anaerolineales bacterium]
MNKYLFPLVILFGVAACTRSVSPSGLPDATQDPLESIFSTIATQTALAGGNKAPDEPTGTLGLGGATTTLAASPTTAATSTTTPAPTQEYIVPSSYTLHQG